MPVHFGDVGEMVAASLSHIAAGMLVVVGNSGAGPYADISHSHLAHLAHLCLDIKAGAHEADPVDGDSLEG